MSASLPNSTISIQPATPVAPMGKRTQWGAIWMMMNTIVAKFFGFFAQIVLGWLLSEDDFALYAIAISVSSFTALLSDSGLRNLLIQRKGEYDRLIAPVFWLSCALNGSTAVCLGLLAPIVAHTYGEPALLPILLIIGLSTFLATPGTVLSAKLRIQMRFKALSMLQLASSSLRYVSTILFAWWGFGVISFVLPVLLVNLVEGVATWLLTAASPWREEIGYSQWPKFLREARWILVNSFSIGILNNGLYLALGAFVDKRVVGIYFFAYQIVVQIGILLSNNLFQVLFPAFSHLAHESDRSRFAMDRALRVVMLGSALGLGLLPLYDPIEHLIWQGKWHETIRPVQILSLTYPISVLLSVAMAWQAAQGLYRMTAFMSLALGIGTITAGLCGAFWGRSANSIALASGLFTFFGSLTYIILTLRAAQLPPVRTVGSLLKIWAVGVLAAGLPFLLDLSGFYPWSNEGRIVLGGFLFLTLYTAFARLFLSNAVQDAAEHMPARIGDTLLRILRMPPRTPLPKA